MTDYCFIHTTIPQPHLLTLRQYPYMEMRDREDGAHYFYTPEYYSDIIKLVDPYKHPTVPSDIWREHLRMVRDPKATFFITLVRHEEGVENAAMRCLRAPIKEGWPEVIHEDVERFRASSA
ncbi:hypothetical protein ACMA5I_05450 [Paracoccaceae bacterium GXU_MW_L88]